LLKSNQALSKVIIYFQHWCWIERSRSKRLADAVTRICFGMTDSWWGTHLQCFSLYPILFTKWYRTIVIEINICLLSCWSDAKCSLSSARRMALSIESDSSVSGSSGVASEESAKFRFCQHRVMVE
jgi:hypothetical protein